ncbi:MAG TPA: hypothetical protein DDY20_03400 [Desulfobulbaceae bacterium]|nr:hypothetical protein [Desulfobulbaceae bacterium]
MNSLFLSYAGPPLLGAFIGYLTNKVAIRMLFRPLKRWRVLGIPVPMTPGVIPAKRHDLARNIGEMVGAHLLTSRDIGSALSEERFQDHLRVRVDSWVNELLARELGPVPSLVPERFQAYLKVAVRTFKFQVRRGIHRSIQGDEFASKVSRAVMEQLRMMGDRPLNSLVSRNERQAVYGFIDTLVSDLLAGERTGEWLAGHLRENLRNSVAQDKTIADYLPAPLQELLLTSIRQRSPEILHLLGRMLGEPPVRERIILLVRGAVENFIGSLGPLGAMASGFLNMDRLEVTFREYLSGREGDVQAWVENQEVQQHFSAVLTGQAEKFLYTKVARFLEGVAEEQLDSVCREVALQVLGLLRNPGVQESLAALFRESFEEMLGQGERKIGDLSGQFLDSEAAGAFANTLAGETVALLRSQRAAKVIDKMLNSMFDALLKRPVGVLNTLLPAGVRSGLADYAALTINRILLREVPSIVESLNIRQIVTSKVDSLDLLRLERLLLSIMEEQFKYINLFGALLGFLLGLINLLLLRLS